MSVYDALISRLQRDAAAAVSALLQAQGQDVERVEASEILADRAAEGRWIARVNRPASGWLGDYSGDTRGSEAEALCSLIERARRDVEAAGGAVPLHLVLAGLSVLIVTIVDRPDPPRPPVSRPIQRALQPCGGGAC